MAEIIERLNRSSSPDSEGNLRAERRRENYLQSSEYYELKSKIHNQLIDLLDLSRIDSLDPQLLRSELKKLVERLLKEGESRVLLNFSEKERLFQEIFDEVTGLGPIEPLLQDATISDILVNTYKQVYVERFGKLEQVEVKFKDEVHLRRIIDKIVSAVGRRIDESSPMVDARLADGSRINAIIPPLALDGSILSIRRFATDPLEMDDLITLKTLVPEVGEILKGIVKARLNVVISGGTGSGKTTLLNVLSRFIPADERIITIEDSAELQLKQEHVVRLETRPANIEGRGQVTQRDLVKNSLRMRPDRIIVGEVRGEEAMDMLQAMNTGHDGSLTTIHANSPRDALMRMETLVSISGVNISPETLRKYISSALDIIIQVARLADGTRKMLSIQEITGMESNIITLQEVFSFEQKSVDAGGKVKGIFRAKGIRPRFIEKFKSLGIALPLDYFDPHKFYEV
jgi:pilus assembly protein CpaF